jgi:hypothetical protein
MIPSTVDCQRASTALIATFERDTIQLTIDNVTTAMLPFRVTVAHHLAPNEPTRPAHPSSSLGSSTHFLFFYSPKATHGGLLAKGDRQTGRAVRRNSFIFSPLVTRHSPLPLSPVLFTLARAHAKLFIYINLQKTGGGYIPPPPKLTESYARQLRMASPAPVRFGRRISEYLRERRTPGAPARRCRQ